MELNERQVKLCLLAALEKEFSEMYKTWNRHRKAMDGEGSQSMAEAHRNGIMQCRRVIRRLMKDEQ